jgi:hypothetical protein
VVGPPALRFREVIEPQPDLTTRPPAGAPPHPSSSHPVREAVEMRADAASSSRAVTPAAPHSAAQQDDAKASAAPESGTTPVAILPDETRPKVRPEDFLPYFRFPGAGPNPEDVSSVPEPAKPGMQPPSSATYKQQ